MNKKEIKKVDYSVFFMESTSFFKKKRISEALKMCELCYPYKISEKQVLIIKNRKKSSYIVFVLKEELIPGMYFFLEKLLISKFKKKNLNIKILSENEEKKYSICNGSLVKNTGETNEEIIIYEKELFSNAKKQDLVIISESFFILLKRFIKKILFLVLIFLFCTFIYIGFFKEKIKKADFSSCNIEQEKSLLEAELEKKHLQEVFALKEEYEVLCKNKNLSVFQKICVLQNQINQKNNFIIESLFIEKNTFSFDATCKNAIKVFKSFENKNSFFENTKLNRISSSNEGDFVNISGNFKENLYSCFFRENPKEENVESYKNLIKKEKSVLEDTDFCNVSFVSEKIRSDIFNSGANFKSMQTKKTEDGVIIDCFFSSGNKNLLRVLKKLSEYEPKINVILLRVKNNGIPNEVNTQISIFVRENKCNSFEILKNLEFPNVADSEIENLFVSYKKKSQEKTAEKSFAENENLQKTVENSILEKNILPKKNLFFVGRSFYGNKKTALLKDCDFGTVYKIPFCDSESEENCFFAIKNSHFAKINGILYGVEYEKY